MDNPVIPALKEVMPSDPANPQSNGIREGAVGEGLTRPAGQPLPSATPPDKRTTGLYGKFYVRRTDGTDRAGGKHDGCDYFVLDLSHDPHAYKALKAYIESCSREYPVLADDLTTKLIEMRRRGLGVQAVNTHAALSGVVQRLADSEPWAFDEPNESLREHEHCIFCGNHRIARTIGNHADDCLWQQAKDAIDGRPPQPTHAALLEGLRTYGQHKGGCDWHPRHRYVRPDEFSAPELVIENGACTCGFEALLAQLETRA